MDNRVEVRLNSRTGGGRDDRGYLSARLRLRVQEHLACPRSRGSERHGHKRRGSHPCALARTHGSSGPIGVIDTQISGAGLQQCKAAFTSTRLRPGPAPYFSPRPRLCSSPSIKSLAKAELRQRGVWAPTSDSPCSKRLAARHRLAALASIMVASQRTENAAVCCGGPSRVRTWDQPVMRSTASRIPSKVPTLRVIRLQQTCCRRTSCDSVAQGDPQAPQFLLRPVQAGR